MDSTSIELARVIARASTTIPTRFWSVGLELVALEDAVISTDTGKDSRQGGGDGEQAGFFAVFLRSSEAGCSLPWMSTEGTVETVSSLDFLKALPSTAPIERRFTDVLVNVHGISASVTSDSGVDCLVSSSDIGDEERHVKGEERREGDSERDLDRDLG